MNEQSTCFWNVNGVCIFDISQPGGVLCCAAGGCKDYEPKITTKDYKGAA